MRAATLSTIAALLLSSCGAEPEEGTPRDIQGSWVLEEVVVSGEPYAVPVSSSRWEPDISGPAVFRFEADGWLTGALPCNKVQGHYSFTGGALTFDVMREAVLCREPEGIMNAEEVIVRVLEGDAVSVGFDGPDLMRWTAADIVLTLARIPTD